MKSPLSEIPPSALISVILFRESTWRRRQLQMISAEAAAKSIFASHVASYVAGPEIFFQELDREDVHSKP